MRLFIAIDIPGDIKLYLNSIQGKIGEEFAKAKWVKKEQMHLTLKFLGQVQPCQLTEIKNILQGINFEAFILCLDSIGVFPDENNVKVVWIGLKPESEINELQKRIDGELKVVSNKERNFKAHLTIGRINLVKDRNKFIERLKKIEIEKREFNVKMFSIIKSVLTADGPMYENIEKFKCQT